ncbi:MAG: VTT domain-containing protein [Candidatus Woesearchaeota archaeon]
MMYMRHKFFQYNERKKVLQGTYKMLFLFTLAALIIIYNLGAFQGTFVETIVAFIFTQIFSGTFLGHFLFGFFAGLFFLTIPIEPIYIGFLIASPNPAITGLLIFTGLCISYTLNYLIGYYLSSASRNMVSPKQFYKIKVKLNRYGAWAIFFFNLFPFPSQILVFMCGVFKYNRTRLALIWLSAWILKLSVLTIFFI